MTKQDETQKRIKELIHLILCNPIDVKLLKQEYYQLTGKQFRRPKNS